MSRIEENQGITWAREICFEFGKELTKGNVALIQVLERGLVEKPEDYKKCVLKVIEVVRSVNHGEARQVHQSGTGSGLPGTSAGLPEQH